MIKANCRRVFTCSSCGWFRDLRTDDLINEYIEHPHWGTVSWEECARLDIKAHRCAKYLAVLAVAQQTVLTLANYKDVVDGRLSA